MFSAPGWTGAAPRSRRGGGLRGGLCRLLLGSRCENGREGAVLEQLEGGVLLALLESGDGELDGALLRVRGRSGQGQVRARSGQVRPGQARPGQGKVRVRSHPNKQEQARHIQGARPGDVRFWWQGTPIGSSRQNLGASRRISRLDGDQPRPRPEALLAVAEEARDAPAVRPRHAVLRVVSTPASGREDGVAQCIAAPREYEGGDTSTAE